MKICAVQTKPLAGDVRGNIEKHCGWIERASAKGARAVIFPELSLTGYEPKLAEALASEQGDARFDVLQELSDARHLTVGVGMPIRSQTGIRIGMLLFQPRHSRQLYCKQHLHSDELPYFVPGDSDLLLDVSAHKIAPAICYESLLAEHAENASKRGAQLYAASVAKSARGVDKAAAHFPEVARRYGMSVLMANCVGPCDDFVASGRSAVWNDRGELLGQLDETSEGLLLFDTISAEVVLESTD
jgi:predicted amidohydrolase